MKIPYQIKLMRSLCIWEKKLSATQQDALFLREEKEDVALR